MARAPVDQLSQSDLVRLKNDKKLLTIFHQPTKCEKFRVVAENVPAAMVKAFSGYCDEYLRTNPQPREHRSKPAVISITGAIYEGIEEVFDFMLSYCDDKTYLPEARGPPMRFWMGIHEAAEILELSFPILADIARNSFLTLLKRPVTKADLSSVVQAFALGTLYSDLVLDKLTAAIVNSKGSWHPESVEYHQLGESESSNEIRFYQILKGSVYAELWDRETNSQETLS